MKAYINTNGIIYIDSKECMEEVAEILKLKTIEVKDIEELVKTEVIKDNEWLTKEEIENLYIKYKDLYDDPEFDLNEIKDKIKNIIFTPTLVYRGGEKIYNCSCTIFEDPIEKCKDWEDHDEFYEIKFDNIYAEDLYKLLKDIQEEFSD